MDLYLIKLYWKDKLPLKVKLYWFIKFLFKKKQPKLTTKNLPYNPLTELTKEDFLYGDFHEECGDR